MPDAADMSRAELAKDKVIAKRGDVLLEPRHEGKPVGTLLVSSHVLSLASPVFDDMFNGNFSEGQTLSTSSPKKIPLPDDDPEALILLCKITHLQTSQIAKIVPLGQFADFAILCDKYQCTEAVAFWSSLQIAEYLSKPLVKGIETLVFVTYVLDMPREFQQVTTHIIRDHGGLLNDHKATHGSIMVPVAFLNEIRTVRNAASAEVFSKIWPKAYDNLLTFDCATAPLRLQAYLLGLRNAKIPTHAGLPIAEARRRSLVLKDQLEVPSCEEHTDCAVTLAKNMNHEVAQGLADAYDKVKNCCMDCMQRKFLSSMNLCRLGHPPHLGPNANLGSSV